MALFSRRSKDSSETPADDAAPEEAVDSAVAGASIDAPDATSEADDAAAAASVSISVSSYGGLGASAPPPAKPQLQPRKTGRAATKVAPRATETVPGLQDNVLVREALARLADGTAPQALLDVARQCLQGHLFLRIKGDARALLAEGKELPLAMVKVGDRAFALAYSSGAALQASVRADGDADTSALGQPVLSVIKHVLAGPYEGLVLDQSSAPARVVLPKDLLKKLLEKVDEKLAIKTLLAAERTPETAAAVAQALAEAPLWVAVGKLDDGRPGIAEGRAEDGSRYLEVYSHPVEVAVMGRGDQAAPVTAAQLAAALGDEGLAGVIVDPAGPWIRLSRDELAPVFATAA
ncbi:SseB family protein [Microbacterium sp. CFH 31415]|uniref:SseB family protein n=1 Tax=Microbacterium sp. CFH 31415 TaxID=2921732 RepID=UPI001F13E1D8|nr:SseB family protein [Microbacterium sp. CFH 31415]MCH6231854.1 SseB family protein [Microbacterium sp. CFH 31415]